MSLNSNCDPKEKLTIVNKSLAITNKALQDLIRSRDDEMKRLAHFERQFESAQEKYEQYRKLAEEQMKQTYDLVARLQEENERDRRIKENLESDIAKLKRDIEGFSLANDRLEKEFKENVDKLQRLKSNSEQNSITSPPHIMSNPSSLIQRLRAEDLK